MEELQVVRRERDRAVAEQRTLQLTVSSLEQEKQVFASFRVYTVHTQIT